MAECYNLSSVSTSCCKVNGHLMNKCYDGETSASTKCVNSSLIRSNNQFLSNNIKRPFKYLLKHEWITILLWILVAQLFANLDRATASIIRNHHSNDLDTPNYLNHNEGSHTIIRPKLYDSATQEALSSTLQPNGLHTAHITLIYVHRNQDVIIDLHRNDNLLPSEHFLRYQTSNGGSIIKNYTKTEANLCQYNGKIRDVVDSSAAISTCNGINGIMFDGNAAYHVHAGPDGKLYDDHFLYSANDIERRTNATCGYEGGIVNEFDPNIPDIKKHTDFHGMFRFKRAVSSDTTVRGPYNANKHSSYVELILVVDNKIYKHMDQNMKKVHERCKDIANIINALYEPLNIFIALVGVVVWNESDEVELDPDGDITLKNFLRYRREKLLKDHPNDNAQLLTREVFTGGVVGKALKGPICTYEFSGGVSMDHSTMVSVVATTIAHEMGHNFGMEHDTDDCKCDDDRCIMSASSSSVAPKHWSSCSIDQLNLALHHGMNYCLKNKPTKLFDSPECGNGFVEPGEQCDCGLPEYCENSCCDPYTCMLYKNASCATGECCDLSSCKPRNAGTVCRTAEGECDLPEYCTGESEYCPTDLYKLNAEPCDDGRAFCYEGSCRSRNDQCRILWGPSGQSSEQCYEKNLNGTKHGNCGYDRVGNKFIPCEKDDIYCGMLHCRHLNERLEFGMESVAVLSHSFLTHKSVLIPCRTAVIDLGLQNVDPGLTPNGAKCGTNKMCVDQKCVPVVDIKSKLVIDCPNNCNGNGVCNSKGLCHCYDGFSPSSYCKDVGYGGSVDSGPSANPNEGSALRRVLFIFFLGVVPTVIISLITFYYCKQNRQILWKKVQNMMDLMKSSPPPKSHEARAPSPRPPPNSDDTNSSLLHNNVANNTAIQNNGLFGSFPGFTLKPLSEKKPLGEKKAPAIRNNSNVAYVQPVPVRPPPNVPTTTVNSDTLKRNNKPSVTINTKPVIIQSKANGDINPPALPLLNDGSNPRPLISSPVLEASTCSAKELISPLRSKPEIVNGKIPIRPAPGLPPQAIKPYNKPISENKSAEESTQSSVGIDFISTLSRNGTIKRIKSLLKKDDKPDSSTLQRNPSKVKPTIDKETLKNIKISSPIPQAHDEVDKPSDRTSLNRSQSMRSPTKQADKKVNLHSFGSMRNPSGLKRPHSVVDRPKSPPPRPPPNGVLNDGLYKRPSGFPRPVEAEYDDCEGIETASKLSHISEANSPVSTENIYAMIEEPQPETNDEMGLLGEIVSEIGKKDLDSIYAISANSRIENKTVEQPTYTNTNDNVTNSLSQPKTSNTKPTTTPVARIAPTKSTSEGQKPVNYAVPRSRETSPSGATQTGYKPSYKSLAHRPGALTSTHSTFKPNGANKMDANKKDTNSSGTKPPINVQKPAFLNKNKDNGNKVDTPVSKATELPHKPKVSAKPSLPESGKTSRSNSVERKPIRPNEPVNSIKKMKSFQSPSTNNTAISALQKSNSHLSSVARPTPGKLSHVASIQKKFESTTSDKK